MKRCWGNANLNHNILTTYVLELFKRKKNNGQFANDVEQLDFSDIAGGN